MTTQSQSLRLATDLAKHPYSWPGGYPKFAITNDAEPLCKQCVVTERRSIALTDGHDGWCILGLAVNWENLHLFCAHCGAQIEAAYQP